MSEEKQIEEIATCKNCCHDETCYYRKKTFQQYLGVFSNINKVIRFGCIHHQPKVPEDSVVLSREEYEKLTKELVTEQRAREIAQEYFIFVRKETAKEILEELMKNIEFTFGLDGKAINKLNADFVLNMCKKYGVDLGEEK